MLLCCVIYSHLVPQDILDMGFDAAVLPISFKYLFLSLASTQKTYQRLIWEVGWCAGLGRQNYSSKIWGWNGRFCMTVIQCVVFRNKGCGQFQTCYILTFWNTWKMKHLDLPVLEISPPKHQTPALVEGYHWGICKIEESWDTTCTHA